MKESGVFVISLDFELFWGLADVCDEGQWNTTIQKVYQVVPRLLDLFEKYGVHATWATVGALMTHDAHEFMDYLPKRVSPQTELVLKKLALPEGKPGVYDSEILFAPNLVRQVSARRGQEIGTHTFSHYYCDRATSTPEDFENDVDSAKRIAKKAGYSLRSAVFPRNQVHQDYVNALGKQEIYIYRGIEKSRFKKISARFRNLGTVLWYLDHYFPTLGRHSYPLSEVQDGKKFNVKKSRFFKPYKRKYALIESLKVLHYKAELRYAAKRGEIYHLCWHPHNFALDTERNFAQLESLLRYYAKLKCKYGMKSLSMCETVDLLNYAAKKATGDCDE